MSNYPKSLRDDDDIPFNSVLRYATEERDGNSDLHSYDEDELITMSINAATEREDLEFSPDDRDLIEKYCDALDDALAYFQ